jgi:molecular chaperone Hsp33
MMPESSQSKIITDNLIQPFQTADAGVRGRLVRMGSVVEDILNRHDYPEPVAIALGETLVLAAILGGALKFDGVFTVQIKGSGVITVLAADMTTPGKMRGYAGFDEKKAETIIIDENLGPVNSLFGKGYIAFTIDQGDNKRYQGIVELSGNSLAECMEDYFHKSEQLETLLKVAVDKHDGKWRAGGIMVQRLPDENGQEFKQDDAEEAWNKAQALAATVSSNELTHPLQKSSELLYKLFHEDGVWLYDPLVLKDECSCSSERFIGTLKTFGKTELEELATDGEIKTDCQFCNARYAFSLDELLTSENNQAVPQ